MTREIPLTKGYAALVDDEDYDRAMEAGPWRALVESRSASAYAIRTVRDADGARRTQSLHRFLCGALHGVIDHVNGNGLDNRRTNLRPASYRENERNKPGRGAVAYKGVSRAPRGFRARIRVDGRERFLGRFSTAEEAARAYDRAALEVDPAHAWLNFPPPGRTQHGSP